MKILHFADLHIGVENYGQPDPQTGLSTRLKDFLYTYDYLVSFAIENKVDPRVTNRIWKSMIWSYVDYQKRNFKKK